MAIERGNTVGPSAPPIEPHLRVSGISKRFGGVEALQDVDFEAVRGEVIALVGDNGAGKSTLMKILAGSLVADSGDFYIDGESVQVNSPQEASALGIQIVYQDLALCENLNVAENLYLGSEPLKPGWKFLPKSLQPIDDLLMEKNAQTAVTQLKVKTLQSVRATVGGLSGGQRQAIAIARAVGAESTIVLLDEPTAALGVEQTQQVMDVVKQLRESSHAVVYISHNLKDIFDISDKIMVLRHGANVATFKTSQTNPDEIITAMTLGRGKKNKIGV